MTIVVIWRYVNKPAKTVLQIDTIDSNVQHYVFVSTMHKMYLLNKLDFALMLQFVNGP